MPMLHERGGGSWPAMAVFHGLISLVTIVVPAAASAGGPEAACDHRDARSEEAGPDRATVGRLVRRLGSGVIADRDAAALGLVDLGPAALPIVSEARQTATGARADSLERIERLLGQRAAAQAIEPATVTLRVEDLPAGEALRQVFMRTGSRITLDADAERRISLTGDRLTFWEAVDALLERAGLACDFTAAARAETVAPGAGGGRRPSGNSLRIVDAASGQPTPPAVAAGPLRVSVADVERTGRSETGDDAGSRGARIRLRIAWEPRLEPLLARLPARTLIAEGPAGEAMPAAQRAALIEATIPAGWQWIDIPILLGQPAAPLERLGMLRGTIVLWLAGMEHDFRFAGVRIGHQATDAPPPARIGAVVVRLSDARIVERRLLIRASVTYDEASEALASHHSWLANRRLEACVAAVGLLAQLEERIESRTDRGVTVAAAFALPPNWVDAGVDAADPREVHIRWRLPIAIHELPIDFAIRDVPLTSSRDR